MDMTTDSQREKRNSVIVRAIVRTPGGDEAERRVRNLSRNGACVEHGGELAVGVHVVLHMGTIVGLSGEVMWVTPRLAGLHFGDDIDLDAARKPRGMGARVKAGWMSDIDNAYRKRG